jgi:pimeloyl-ACP methyl ester carboxylesterase
MRNNKVTFFRALAVTALGWWVCVVSGPVLGQDAAPPKTKKKELPERETVTIVTKDNVELRADFFGGINEKDTVPVLILHEFDGSRKELLPLAEYLQKEYGHAVLVPDLRGHGESLTVQGIDKPIDRTRFKKNEIASMYEDIEACKRFLMKKNNLGELNIDLMTVIAMGDTSIHAVRWCVADWRWPPVGGLKQGQDVKGLVLVSPVKRFKSLDMSQDLKSPLISGKDGSPLSILLTWGAKNEASSKDGNFIFEAMNKSRPEVSAKQGDDDWWTQSTLFVVVRGSRESATKFVQDESKDVFNDIGLFIEKKVTASKDDFRWQNRERQ